MVWLHKKSRTFVVGQGMLHKDAKILRATSAKVQGLLHPQRLDFVSRDREVKAQRSDYDCEEFREKTEANKGLLLSSQNSNLQLTVYG